MANIIGSVKGTSVFVTDHIGVLVSIEEVPGTYTITVNGEQLERPNSYLATFQDGKKINWPAWLDENGDRHPWSLFDPSIDLTTDQVHIWRDSSKRFHVESV